MSRSSLSVVVLALCVLAVSAAPGLAGVCKTGKYETVKSLDLSRYVGKWYEIAHSESFFWDIGCHCTTAEYSIKEDGNIKVVNGCRSKSVTGKLSVFEGTAHTTDQPGRLEVSFAPIDIKLTRGPYHVVMVGENYEYAVIVSCSSTPILGGSNIWILSRESTLDQSVYQALVARLVEMGFDTSDLVPTVQQGCWNKVEPSFKSLAAPVENDSNGKCVFPSLVRDFDLKKWEGKWYIVKSQPDLVEGFLTRDCQCSTHNLFENQDGSVTSSHACRQKSPQGSLSKIDGQLVEVSDVSSSMGIFTQTIHGQKTVYQVLAVDEDYQYALLTSCADLFVTRSYCLYFMSRTPTLAPEALDKLLSVAAGMKLLSGDLRTINQENCWSQ